MQVKLPNVRIAFPEIFRATPFKEGDDPTFSATFLIPKGSALDKEIEAAIQETAKAKWGAKAEQILKSIRHNPNRFCYQDGDTKSYDGFEGHMALRAKSKVRPLVIDTDKSPLTEADGRPYSGCYVHASVDIFTYDNSGKGISSQLRGVRFFKDGDAFAAGRPASVNEFDEFDNLGEGATADDLV